MPGGDGAFVSERILLLRMPKISAIIHLPSDEPQLARMLESLHGCDEVVVVDHGCGEKTLDVARAHGARIVKGVIGVQHGAYAQDASHDWILCLLPLESLTQDLQASLDKWKESKPAPETVGYNIRIGEQNGGQLRLLQQELRMADRCKINWTGDCPPAVPEAPILEGYILKTAIGS